GIRDPLVTGVQTCALPILETVDVLCDDGEHFPRMFERDDGVMDGVRLRALIDLPRFQLVVPVLDARGFRREKLAVLDRTPPRPHPAGPAEVWDRSEERRVGKERRGRWGAEHCRKRERVCRTDATRVAVEARRA